MTLWLLVSWPFAGHKQNYKPGRKEKIKRNANSSSYFVVEEMICSIGTVVAQERLAVSNFLKDTYLINLRTVCGLFFFFPGTDPVKYTEGQMLLLVFLHGGQLESFSVTKHAFPFCNLPLHELTVGTWDLVLFSLTAGHISLLQHTAKWRPFWASKEDILLNVSVFAVLELFSCPWYKALLCFDVIISS